MRLLVVEDDPDLLAGLLQALRKEGYAVDSASDGEAGLYKARSTDYDAIVLDVLIPRLDGWQLLTRLRETRITPVLMLTALDNTDDRVRGLDSGADDYLGKPFDVPELLARLRALIRRSARQPLPAIELGNVRINTLTRTVTRAGQVIPLTAREYLILEFLALHRGEVVTRSALFDHLFDEDEDTLSNILNVHVSNLRNKLGADLILTRRGHGYLIR